MTTVTLDKAADGKNSNVLVCETKAPVVASWDIKGKKYNSNYAKRKMSATDVDVERVVKLTAMCKDGKVYELEYPITVQELTDPLKTVYIYDGPDVTITTGNTGRFSDNEGCWPFIKDDYYWGFKTLIFEVKDVQPGTDMWDGSTGNPKIRYMSGWWDAFPDHDGDYEVEWDKTGTVELNLTKGIAEVCASEASKGKGHDLCLLVRRGSITVGKIFFEE